MGRKGKCCCAPGCCLGNGTPISKLSFNSPDGLHPISFVDKDIRFLNNPNDFTNISLKYSSGKVECDWIESQPFGWKPDQPHSPETILDGGCCFGGLVLLDELVRSEIVEHKIKFSVDVMHKTTTRFINESITSGCVPLNGEWTKEWNDIYSDLLVNQLRVQRLVAGIAFKGCYADTYLGRKLKLDLRVFYKDLDSYMFSRSTYYKKELLASAGYMGWDPVAFACVLKEAYPSNVEHEIGSYPLPAPPAWNEDPEIDIPAGCESCSTVDPDCVLEYIDRTVYLEPDCEIAGTYTAYGDNTQTNKFRLTKVTCSNPTTDPYVPGYLYPDPTCGLLPGTYGLPIYENTFGISPVDPKRFDFTKEIRKAEIVDINYDIVDNFDKTLMHWWDEDWILTFS